jgi:peptide/nickel transport system substrate-binding protein
MDQPDDRGITRREALRGSLAAGGAVLTAGALAACGGSSSNSSPSTSAATGASAPAGGGKPGGTLQLGLIGSTADTLDAHIATASTGASPQYALQLYDGLTQFDHTYTAQLSMAEEFTPAADAMSWTARLKDGLEFHNGKTVTADDLIFSIQRIINPKNGASDEAQLASIDPKGMKKLDNRTVKINLLYPDVTLFSGFAKYASGIVPVGYDPKNPVGSGAFKFVSFNPLQRVEFAKFPNFWRKDASGTQLPYLDNLTWIAFTDLTAIGNALASNAIEGAAGIAPTQLQLAQANSNLRTMTAQSYAWDVITMRVDTGPFKDVRVRQAMKLMVDRPQFIKEVYSGQGMIGNDIPSYQDPLYDHSIPQRTQDLEQAKSLLKAAGASNLTATIYTRGDEFALIPSAQVFAQQAKAVGANITVQQIDVGTYYTKYYAKEPLSQDYFFTAVIWEAIDYAWMPGAPYNETHWTDPATTNLIKQARGTLDFTKRKEIMAQAEHNMWSEGGWLLWGYQAYNNTLSNKFNGMVLDHAGLGINGSHLYTISQA